MGGFGQCARPRGRASGFGLTVPGVRTGDDLERRHPSPNCKEIPILHVQGERRRISMLRILQAGGRDSCAKSRDAPRSRGALRLVRRAGSGGGVAGVQWCARRFDSAGTLRSLQIRWWGPAGLHPRPGLGPALASPARHLRSRKGSRERWTRPSATLGGAARSTSSLGGVLKWEAAIFDSHNLGEPTCPDGA